jgi:hypothetical protein
MTHCIMKDYSTTYHLCQDGHDWKVDEKTRLLSKAGL